MNKTSSLLNNTAITHIPNVYCLVRGAAEGATKLNAFDNALLHAGVGDTNLIRLSSILPPAASLVDVSDLSLSAGCFLPLAYAHFNSTTPGQIISSAVAVGIPEDPSQAGVIMEHSGPHQLDQTEAKARQMIQNAFQKRQRSLREIRSLGIDHIVDACGVTFAAAVLWYE